MQGLDGKTSCLRIAPKALVEHLMTMLQSRVGVPVEHQRLVCGTRQLNNGATIQHSNVVEGTVLHLVSCLRGGRSASAAFVDVSKPGALGMTCMSALP